MGASVLTRGGASATRRQIPHIDYAAHPAYGGMLPPRPALGAEVEATLRRLIAEVEEEDRVRDAAFGYRYGTDTDISREVAAQGWCARQLAPARLELLRRAASPIVEAIRARLAEMKASGAAVGFKATQEIIGKGSHPDLWVQASKAIREAGLVAAASDYFGADHAALKSAAVMVNQPEQAWCNDVFRDGAIETPPTVGFHIDSVSLCVMKVVLYLDDVGPDQGPFGIVPASHLWEQGSVGRVRRRAFDRSPFVSRARRQRQAFLSLPPELQLKAEFGSDMLPGAPETQDILRQEQVATGPGGQLNIFDPEAVHRGGHARAGERLVMLLSIAAKFWNLAAMDPAS